MSVPLIRIKTNGGTQPRAQLDTATVDKYADAMRAGDTFPPVTVYHDGESYWLADGFHRLAAYRLAHPEARHIIADVKQGDRRDAVLYSVGANATHGLHRSDEDKRRAVLRLLEDNEWSKWSDRKIADMTRTSHPFVGKLRRELFGDETPDERTYTDRHGNETTMHTGNISSENQARARYTSRGFLLADGTFIHLEQSGNRWSASILFEVNGYPIRREAGGCITRREAFQQARGMMETYRAHVAPIDHIDPVTAEVTPVPTGGENALSAILQLSVYELKSHLAERTSEQLQRLLELEKSGRDRSTAVGIIKGYLDTSLSMDAILDQLDGSAPQSFTELRENVYATGQGMNFQKALQILVKRDLVERAGDKYQLPLKASTPDLRPAIQAVIEDQFGPTLTHIHNALKTNTPDVSRPDILHTLEAMVEAGDVQRTGGGSSPVRYSFPPKKTRGVVKVMKEHPDQLWNEAALLRATGQEPQQLQNDLRSAKAYGFIEKRNGWWVIATSDGAAAQALADEKLEGDIAADQDEVNSSDGEERDLRQIVLDTLREYDDEIGLVHLYRLLGGFHQVQINQVLKALVDEGLVSDSGGVYKIKPESSTPSAEEESDDDVIATSTGGQRPVTLDLAKEYLLDVFRAKRSINRPFFPRELWKWANQNGLTLPLTRAALEELARNPHSGIRRVHTPQGVAYADHDTTIATGPDSVDALEGTFDGLRAVLNRLENIDSADFVRALATRRSYPLETRLQAAADLADLITAEFTRLAAAARPHADAEREALNDQVRESMTSAAESAQETVSPAVQELYEAAKHG